MYDQPEPADDSEDCERLGLSDEMVQIEAPQDRRRWWIWKVYVSGQYAAARIDPRNTIFHVESFRR